MSVVYHPDPEIAEGIAADTLEAEVVDLAAGYPARRWRCECGAEHGRGHFMSLGVHRCLGCGYVGTGGVMFGTMPDADGGEGACPGYPNCRCIGTFQWATENDPHGTLWGGEGKRG